MSSLKQQLATRLMPVAQYVVRKAAPGGLRDKAYQWGNWRSLDFTTQTRHGLWMSGNTLDLIQGYLYWFGVWEPNLTHFIHSRMDGQQGRVFADVGANIGYYTLLAARCAPASEVVAIEAFPPTYEKLKANIARNGLKNVDVRNLAASDQPGTLDIYYSGQDNEGGTTAVPGRFDTKPVTVPALPLADILGADKLRRLRVMKIDVEGAEALVIRGLVAGLGQLPADAEVIVEVSADSKDDSQFIFDSFRQAGFHAYALENRYDPASYLHPPAIKRPQRQHQLPEKHTDIVFSRVDAAEL